MSGNIKYRDFANIEHILKLNIGILRRRKH